MNKFKCTNTKNYKLTLNQEYDILEEDGNYVVLVNDAGKTVRYYKELFEELVPAPARTEQDCISSINRHGGNIRYNDLNNNVVTISILNPISVSTSNISCGVHQMSGLDNLLNNIISNIDTSEDDMIELSKALFREAVNILKTQNTSTRFFILSTAFQDQYEDLYPVLDELADTATDWEQNPNSGNRIKVWVISK